MGWEDFLRTIPNFIEEHIRSLSLPTTILRPVFFMENWAHFSKDAILNGRLPQPLSPETRLQQVAVDDIGAFVALAFSSPDGFVERRRSESPIEGKPARFQPVKRDPLFEKPPAGNEHV